MGMKKIETRSNGLMKNQMPLISWSVITLHCFNVVFMPDYIKMVINLKINGQKSNTMKVFKTRNNGPL